ncbi:hypothetical protein KW807_00290 [Candidatus Parcubacteria bacterium]|nr:hypothetical protein [Candidatus Parcubacteria bacterium]
MTKKKQEVDNSITPKQAAEEMDNLSGDLTPAATRIQTFVNAGKRLHPKPSLAEIEGDEDQE